MAGCALCAFAQTRSLGVESPRRKVTGMAMTAQEPPIACPFILKVHIGQRLAGVILHDEASVRLLDGPRRREAASHRRSIRDCAARRSGFGRAVDEIEHIEHVPGGLQRAPRSLPPRLDREPLDGRRDRLCCFAP